MVEVRILVCGGRDYNDSFALYKLLDTQLSFYGDITIIHGDAPGADRLAGRWAEQNGVECRVYPADWETHGKAAGYIRNQQMLLEGKPELVIAFPGGKGTAMMVKLAEQAGVPVLKAE